MEDFADAVLLLDSTLALSLLLARRRRRMSGDGRSEAQVRQHYLVERELADRLRKAPRLERRELYMSLYDELLARLPHHPMLRMAPEMAAREVDRQFGFLRRFLKPGSRYMEIGAGDCAHALRVAPLVSHVCVIEVSAEITRKVRAPENFSLTLTDGCSIDVPANSMDTAFSNQLMEHLHPEDAEEQLHNIYRALVPGGRYVCVTPNRLYGPRDVSAHFDDVATGFHLKEYTAAELRELFLQTGFSSVDFYAGARGWFVRLPYWAIGLTERCLQHLPPRTRRLIADFAPLRALLGLRVVATK